MMILKNKKKTKTSLENKYKLKNKNKLKKKKKNKNKNINVVAPVDPSASDTDWWISFWHKHTSIPDCSVPSDEEEGFMYFFRVSKKTFEYICSLVRDDLVSRPPSGLINIEGRLLSVEKQVAIAMRRLASGDSQVSVGAAFGVGQSTVSQVTWRFVEAMEERGKHHLKWPSCARMEEIKGFFEANYGLVNCCGAIDATHVVMTLPAVETSDDWCDREKNYSMLLQGVVDHEMRFLDLVTGWPGGMSVSRLLKFSRFCRLCESRGRLNGDARRLSGGAEVREYVVGGVGYPLFSWLVTPLENGGISAFENARMLAVRAFSQLKGSWRILSKVMWRPDKSKLPSIILVCCLLHNIMIDNGDKLHPDVALPGYHDSGYKEHRCKQVDPLGKQLRDNLAIHLQSSGEKVLS